MPAIQPLGNHRPAGTERRRHRRFRTTQSLSVLRIVASNPPSLTLTECQLVEIAFGGMRFRAREPMDVGEERSFLAHLSEPFDDLIFLKARIEWSSQPESAMQTYGASFFESSKGWFASYSDDGVEEAGYPGLRPQEVI